MNGDPVIRWVLVVIALALAWQALRPSLGPITAEASRDVTTINIERVGGRFLSDGAIPVKCVR